MDILIDHPITLLVPAIISLKAMSYGLHDSKTNPIYKGLSAGAGIAGLSGSLIALLVSFL